MNYTSFSYIYSIYADFSFFLVLILQIFILSIPRSGHPFWSNTKWAHKLL